jgi:hypothetical protein
MTGTITVEPVKHEEDGKVDIGKLAKSLMEAPVLPNSDIKVLALTHLKIDLDCIQFVKEGLSDSEKPLLEAHNAMVKTATEARNSLMLAIKEIVGLG